MVKTITVSRIQMRLAIELAAQEAAQKEYARQIGEQLGHSVTVVGGEIDAIFHEWPEFDVAGTPVEWID